MHSIQGLQKLHTFWAIHSPISSIQSPNSSLHHLSHLIHVLSTAPNSHTPLRHTQSPCQCTIASVSKQSHTSLVHQTTHLIHDHCMPKQSHTSSTRPIALLMHNPSCAQSIADLFGAPSHTPSLSLCCAQSPTLCNPPISYTLCHGFSEMLPL